MRKIFIALFLIFFAHCECVLATTPEGVICTVLTDASTCGKHAECKWVKSGDSAGCVYLQCNERKDRTYCIDDCFWDTRNGKCMRNKCNGLGKDDCVAEAGCYYVVDTCYITEQNQCKDSKGSFSSCPSETPFSNPGSSCTYGCLKLEEMAMCIDDAGMIWDWGEPGCDQPGSSETCCIKSPAGTYSAEYSGSARDCEAGTYSDTPGSAECTGCPAGQWSQAGSTTCTNCPAGTYSATGSSTCTQCPAGTYSAAGSSTCTQCSDGTYSTLGSAECTGCPTGSTTSGAGAKSKNDCNVCEPGYYYESNTGCTKCMLSTSYCPGGAYAEQKSCPPGTVVPTGVVGTSEDHCQYDEHKCKNQDGYYVNNEKCDICPAGYYCPAGHPDRVQCPSETPVSDPGSGEIINCRAITGCADVASIAGCGGSDDNVARKTACRNMAGCYWKETEKICADCPEEFYCTNCSADKAKCPTGTTSESGAKQKSDCYLVDNKLKQNGTTITTITIPSMSDPYAKPQPPYTGHLYFYTTVLENCPPASAVCPAPDGAEDQK